MLSKNDLKIAYGVKGVVYIVYILSQNKAQDNFVYIIVHVNILLFSFYHFGLTGCLTTKLSIFILNYK